MCVNHSEGSFLVLVPHVGPIQAFRILDDDETKRLKLIKVRACLPGLTSLFSSHDFLLFQSWWFLVLVWNLKNLRRSSLMAVDTKLLVNVVLQTILIAYQLARYLANNAGCVLWILKSLHVFFPEQCVVCCVFPLAGLLFLQYGNIQLSGISNS